jgi:hypothetical protein
MQRIPRELTKEEYEATFAPPMPEVTETAEEIVDLWSYADPVLANMFPDAGDWAWHVKHIYESRDGSYQHLNVPIPRDNAYLSVVVNKSAREVLGHYVLYLGAMYPNFRGAAST